MNWTLLLIVVIILLGLLFLISILLPNTIRTTVEVHFGAPIQSVWDVYSDFESQPNWRSDVEKIEMTSDNRSWTETLKKSKMTIRFKILEEIPPSRLVLQTSAPRHFEGKYVAEFRQVNGGTVGVFTEESTALGLLPKVLRCLFFHQEKFIKEYANEAQKEIRRRETNFNN